jgi:hypothetical protein
MNVITTLTCVIQHAQEGFLYSKCDVHTYECDYDTQEYNYYTYEFDYNKHEIDFDTQSTFP